jgi:MerR family mercuric resistance operon transcriptional regulator
MQPFTIGRVAHQAGVGVETVRLYERQGLITQPPRGASGYRHYPEETVARLRCIQRAKALGFSLREIRELLSLRVDPTGHSGAVKARAQAKIAAMEENIRTLRRIKESLACLAAACDGCAPVRACPILDALAAEEHERHRPEESSNTKRSKRYGNPNRGNL